MQSFLEWVLGASRELRELDLQHSTLEDDATGGKLFYNLNMYTTFFKLSYSMQVFIPQCIGDHRPQTSKTLQAEQLIPGEVVVHVQGGGGSGGRLGSLVLPGQELLHYWTTALLDYWTTGLLDYCTTGLLHYCTTALLHYCTTRLLHYGTTALLP